MEEQEERVTGLEEQEERVTGLEERVIGPEAVRLVASVMESEEGATRIEYKTYNGEWQSCRDFTMAAELAVSNVTLRLKPRRVLIHGPGGSYSFPEPINFEPSYGQECWVARPDLPEKVSRIIWRGTLMNRGGLASGFLQPTKERAIEQAKSIVKAQQGYAVATPMSTLMDAVGGMSTLMDGVGGKEPQD